MGGSSKGAQDSAQVGNTSGRGASTWAPNAAVSPLYGGILQNLQNLAYTPVPYFQGQAYVGPSQGTQQGVGMALQGVPYYEQGANALAGAAPAMQGLNQAALGNYSFLSNAADVGNNPYVQGMLDQNSRNARDFLTREALPALNNAGASVNALGSSRLGIAQGKAIGDQQRNLVENNRATQFQAYQQGLQAQQNALGYTGNMLQNLGEPGRTYGAAGNMFGTGGQQAMGAGQAVENYQQRALDDAMARHSYMYEEPWNRMGQVANYLTGLFGDTGTGYTSETGSGTSTGAAKTKQSGGLFK